ncbi:WLM domain [Seminavis robusta]|uniref:WLM domain n=1 Tax=Seminavis robusta TaxID=568900 RepID=A0A9N8DPJ0_9STRA|nr:WLM domain [Seminavis robusta]|eukprot:Sro169_g075130.1 WLM domain (393) ;mRNA; r:52679-53933
MAADDNSLWIESLDIPIERIEEDDSYRSRSIEELPSRIWRSRRRPPSPPKGVDEEAKQIRLDLGVSQDLASPKGRDNTFVSTMGTTILVIFVGFVLWQKLNSRRQSKLEDGMARQHTEDARARRLARVPESYGKRKKTSKKNKITLPQPDKYLPKVTIDPALLCKPVASDTNSTSSQEGTGSAIDGQRDFALQLGIMASLNQKDGSDESSSDVFAAPGFYHIPNLPNEEYAKFLLKRLAKDFLPIIRRRGFKILAVSEMCCCIEKIPSTEGEESWDSTRIGDGDVQDIALGYNRSVTVVKLGEEYHEIFVRLRTRHNHDKFRTYGEIDTTVAHELAHCVHPNHSFAFYQLMAEIQHEHYKVVDSMQESETASEESVMERFGYDIYKSSTNGA